MGRGLQGATVDVELSGLDQKSTEAGAVPGELSALINARARKFTPTDGGARLRIEKREGFTRLTQNVFEPTTGGFVGATSIANASLLATRQDQAIAINSSSQAYVYEPEQPAWERQDAYQITNKLTREPIYTPNAQITTPDGAAVGNTLMYVWRDGTNCKALLRDRDGTLIRAPFTVQTAGRIKVTSDGSRFWVITDNNTTNLQATVFTAGGSLAGTTSIDTMASAASAWDVIYQPSVGVCVVRPVAVGPGVHLTTLAWSAGITTVASGDNSESGDVLYGVAFLANPNNDGLVYVASVEDGDNPILHVVSMEDDATNSHDYVITALSGTQFRIANFAGFVVPATLTVRLTWTQLDVLAGPVAGDMKNNLVYGATAPVVGSPSVAVAKRSVSLASRAFTLNNRWMAVVYYASAQSALDLLFGLTFRQATFFLLDLETLHIVGRFEYGTAAMDWTVLTWTGSAKPVNGFMLPSPFIDGASTIHFPLGYRATAQASRLATDESARFLAANGAVFVSWAPDLFQQYTNTIGVLDVSLLSTAGKAVEFNELLLPGAVASSFSGQDFGESNFNLAPERPIGITQDSGGLTEDQTYQICVVWEWTNAAGQRVKSAPSPPLSMSMGNDSKIVLTINTLRVTEHTNVMASVYMTYMVNGLMSTTFAKATDDLSPTYNDQTVDTISWNTGTLTDDQIAVGEPLYTDGDPGHLPNYPAPPFSHGCQAWNRVFVIGPDGAVWFSFEDDEVSALAFNPAFRILPPNEPFTKVVNMDAFLLIGSEKHWYVLERGNLLDSTGAGQIPTPALLPFPNGVTGAVQATREGCFYGSSAGGIWMITRDLSNLYVGAKAEDYTSGLTIADMVTDKDQNVIASVTNYLVVWDPVSRLWSKWVPGITPGRAPLLAQYRGKALYSDLENVWLQTANQFYDSGASTIPIVTTITTAPIHLGGVKNFKRLWDMQMFGEYLGDHDMTVTVTYDDTTSPTVATYAFTPDSTAPYQYQLPVKVELCTSVAYTFVDSFPRGASRGYALELISLYVGLEKGLARVPIARRIAPTG